MKTKIITTDIYLASALLALGAKIESTDKTDLRHIKFSLVKESPDYTFKSENLPELGDGISERKLVPVGLDEYETQWANGTLMINAVAFKNAIQQMKSVIHSS